MLKVDISKEAFPNHIGYGSTDIGWYMGSSANLKALDGKALMTGWMGRDVLYSQVVSHTQSQSIE